MKRDLRLVANILLHHEELGTQYGESKGYSYEHKCEISAHYYMMINAGLIKEHSVENRGAYSTVYEITWAGRDYLDSVRDKYFVPAPSDDEGQP